jgi:hypothetical protein
MAGKILISVRGREILARVEEVAGVRTGYVTFADQRAKCPLAANPIDEDGFAIPIEILRWED